jgi:putative two-component system response regulator
MQLSTIFALVKLTDYRDDILGSHLERTQLLCKLIAEKLAEYPKYNATITSGFIDNLYKASPLHDIGKVGIPDGIYLKPTKLTTEEFEIIKGHTTIGADTLKSILDRFPGNEFIRIGIDIARFHHEKWNGAGYPDGLIGEAIPLTARIMAVSDVFDALRTKRPYKNPFSHEDSIQIIIDGSGNHFDPSVVEAFLAIESSVKPLYV